MTLPALAVANSGWGGRGYKDPVEGDGRIVPSITTVLKGESKPALVQWAVDQTAGYAVANATQLLTHSEDWGFKFLRWYHKREVKEVTPETNIHNYHEGVLSDASSMGSWMHEWIQGDVVPELAYPDTENQPETSWQMVEAWDKFHSEHEIVPHFTERTVWNGELGYAGTLDGVWMIDGVYTLLDIKTSRGLHTSTWMQLAALYACPDMFVPRRVVVQDTEKDEYFKLRDWQLPVTNAQVLHVRPRDWDNRGNEMAPFCRLVPMLDQRKYFAGFKGLLAYGQAMRDVRVAQREREKNDAGS